MHGHEHSRDPTCLQRLAFESFRDLVKLVRTGLVDGAGLAYVENEALDIRVAARSKASAAAGVIISKVLPALSIPGAPPLPAPVPLYR